MKILSGYPSIRHYSPCTVFCRLFSLSFWCMASVSMFRENLPMAKELNCGWILLDMCIWISLLNPISYLSLIYISHSSQDFSSLDRKPVSIEMIFPLHTSAIIFVFSDFSAHGMKWLLCNIRDYSTVHILNVSLAQSRRQILDFPTRFPINSEGQTSLLDLMFTSH